MRNRNLVFLALFALGFSGCATTQWAPGWTLAPISDSRPAPADALAVARRLGDAVDSPETARAAIRAWETVATVRPNDPEVWIEIACLRLLEGAAYRQRAEDRLVCYIAALQACERAMATNPEYLRRVQAGQTAWEAAAALGPREMGAMHFWSTGVFYIFRDCLGLIGRIANVAKMDGAKAMLERMDAIDPTWEEHTTTFSWGIYYLAMPSSRGGDKARARECFDRAVALGEHRLLPRWGRGKYFYPAVGEAGAARADLEAVLPRDLDGLGGNRSWNRYFKADAVRLLAE
jgi:tetratricopeptide (TPR) repeat protein